MTSQESARKPTLSELADALEEEQLKRLLIVKSALFTMGEVDPTAPRASSAATWPAHVDGR